MFTPSERGSLRSELLEAAASDPRICAAAITGSAAAEREDKWSDIDLAFGIAVPRHNSDLPQNQVYKLFINFCLLTCKTGLMLRLLGLLVFLSARLFCSRRDLLLENLALRQQLGVFKQKHPLPRFAAADRLFWIVLRRFWVGWSRALILVQPETVVRWHRAGFKLYWTWLSRHRRRAGRKCVSMELREITVRMVSENSTWGAPRIHGELKMPASIFPNEACCAGCGRHRGVLSRQSDG